jgi:hypothetical protein
MGEKEYIELCQTCDNVLLSTDSTNERVGIPWLHIIREHPIFLSNYIDLFTKHNRLKRVSIRFIRILKYLAGWMKQIIIASRSSSLSYVESGKTFKETDVLFISHILNFSQAGKQEDFYFDLVPSELLSKGFTTTIVLINHSNESETFIVDKWKLSDVKRIVLSKSLGIIGDLKLFRRILRESAILAKFSKKEQPGLMKDVLSRASDEALSGSTRNTLRIHHQIGLLCNLLKPKVIVVTHEGHAWERLAFAAARESCPSVKCIGYHHSTLFRLQHSIKRNLFGKFNPDIIMTSGLIAKYHLEKARGLNGIQFSVLGSNRNFSRIETLQAFESKIERLQDICLVIPEGELSECNLLFEFSKACAIKCPSIQFIWRLHPVINFEIIVKQNSKLKNLPINITLSDSSLQEDLALSRWALYRGTTTIVRAVGNGVQPIYLQVPGEMTIDPLYDIDDWKIKVKDVADFIEAVKFNEGVNQQSSQLEKKSLISYCESIFMKFRSDALILFLQKGI